MHEAANLDDGREGVWTLIDSLDSVVASAPSSMLRSHVRLNRKKARALVDAIGATPDVRSALQSSVNAVGQPGTSKPQMTEIFLAEAFKTLEHLVANSGGGES